MPYMCLLTVLVAALFSAVALSATLSCVNYFAFHTGLTCRRVVMLRGCPPGRDPAPFPHVRHFHLAVHLGHRPSVQLRQ